MTELNRRDIVLSAPAAGLVLAAGRGVAAAAGLDTVYKAIEQHHVENVARLRGWIRQATIAAEQRGLEEGCSQMMGLLEDAGCQHVERMPTDGVPPVRSTSI